MIDKDVARGSFAAFLTRTWWLWCGAIAVYALLAASLPPTDDEVYYWTWSKSLQLSYYDHPGMTAWLIWLSTQLFGDTILGMRFPACCCVALTLAVITYLTSQRPPTASAGPLLRKILIHPLILGLAFTPLFTFGGILITPDAPLVACWSLYLLWLVELHEAMTHQRATWQLWPVGGVLLGCGGLSKYTMILAVAAGFASFLLSGVSSRKWLAGYASHGAISMLVASPILIYNVQHHFEPIQFQWRHAMHDEPATWITFLEFFGVQLLLFGTLPFYIVPWTIRQFPALRANPRLRVCTCLFLIPLAFFAYKAARTELEGNWGLVAFVSVWPVAAAWYATVDGSRFWSRMTAAGFLAPAIGVALLAIHLVSPLPIPTPERDRLAKFRGRWQMSQQLADVIRQQDEAIPVFHHTYQLTALLRFHGIDARQEGTTRPSHFTFPPEQMAEFPAAYLVTNPSTTPPQVSGMGAPELLGTFPTMARGKVVNECQLWRYARKAEISAARTEARVRKPSAN